MSLLESLERTSALKTVSDTKRIVTSLQDWEEDELRHECCVFGLPSIGSRDELINRLAHAYIARDAADLGGVSRGALQREEARDMMDRGFVGSSTCGCV